MKQFCVFVLFVGWGLLLAAAPARADIIYQSATLGATGQTGGAIVNADQFLGARFTLTSAAQVTDIGGHIANSNAGDFFGAIVSLSSPTAFPAGSPFTMSDVLASADFVAGFPSSDVVVPLSVSLPAGSYAVIFGTGTLGASGANGFMPTDNTDNASASYIVWNGSTSTWSNASVNDLYFEVDGTAVPEPSSLVSVATSLLAIGLLAIGSNCRKPRTRAAQS